MTSDLRSFWPKVIFGAAEGCSNADYDLAARPSIGIDHAFEKKAAFGAAFVLGIFLNLGTAEADELKLARFADCQEKYCSRLVEMLNSPIEWHIVLDVSKSYGKSPVENVSKIHEIVRHLPLIHHDALCFDSFDLDFYPGSCIDIEEKVYLEAPKVFANKLLEAVQAESQQWTDLKKAVTKATERPPTGEIHRQYFIYITDGRHDPGKPQKLFEDLESPDSFIEKITDFVQPQSRVPADLTQGQLTRGLFFVIDKSRARPAERDDWLTGYSRLHNLDQASQDGPSPGSGSRFLPRIALMDLGEEETRNSSFDEQLKEFVRKIRADVDRHEGVFACLLSAQPLSENASGQTGWPTVHGFTYPSIENRPRRCPSWPQPVYELTLPPSKLQSQPNSVPLSVHVLAFGANPSRKLIARFQSLPPGETGSGPETGFPRETTIKPVIIQLPAGQNPDLWRQERIDLDLALSPGAVNGQRLPISVQVEFSDMPQSRFMTMEVQDMGPLTGESFERFLQDRGVLAACISVFLFMNTWLLLFLATRKPSTLSVSLKPETGDVGPGHNIDVVLHHNGLRIQAGPDGQIEDWHQVRPSHPPDLGEDDPHFFLDVIPVGLLVYYLLWRHPKSSHPKLPNRRAMDVTGDQYFGEMLPPGNTWVPSSTHLQNWHDLNWLQRLWHRCWQINMKWGESTQIETQGKSIACDLSLRLHRWHRLFRILAIVTHAFAAAAAGIAIWQFLAPATPVVPGSIWPILGMIGLMIVLARMALHFVTRPKSARFVLLINRIYFIGSIWLLFSSLVLIAMPGGHAFILFVLSALFLAFTVTGFLLPYWVRRRVSERKGFVITDIFFDTFLSYGPIAC